MEKDQLGDELIAKQTFRRDAGAPSLNGFPAAGAIFPLQAAEDTLGAHGPRVDKGTLPKTFNLQRAAPVGTSHGLNPDFLDTVGAAVIYALAVVAVVAAVGAALFRSLLLGGVLFEGLLGGGDRGTKGALLPPCVRDRAVAASGGEPLPPINRYGAVSRSSRGNDSHPRRVLRFLDQGFQQQRR
jgi:hypothetical protein